MLNCSILLNDIPNFFMHRQLPLPPGPWVIPYIGDTLRLIYQGLIKISTDRQAIYGPIHQTWILGERNVFVADAACVRKILNGEHTIAEGSCLQECWMDKLSIQHLSLCFTGLQQTASGTLLSQHRDLHVPFSQCCNAPANAANMVWVSTPALSDWVSLACSAVRECNLCMLHNNSTTLTGLVASELCPSFEFSTSCSAEDWPLGVCMLLGYKSVAVLTFDDHLNMRKLMTPAFNPKHLARGIPRLVELAEEHCSEWAEQGEIMGAKAIKAFTFHVST